ncbi:hypothetical protein [Adhaeribacter aquaticus]|uniref:hypothetical protein n=1 Tax=Adhaeribacter aquaticus TaxID=299567 RepID=UPI00042503E9|nr:hypothetical protein [Adhaeribacter aquaticus]
MVVDYLNRLGSLDVSSLTNQDKEDFLTVLSYLEKREKDPARLNEITHQMERLAPELKRVKTPYIKFKS